jgi:hypothetical protein
MNKDNMSKRSRQKLKESIFRIASEAIKKIGIHSENIYICPICGNKYSWNDVGENKLRLEHIPQRKLSGKPLLFTCFECNTKRMSSIDEELVNREKALSVMSYIFENKSTTTNSVVLSSDEWSIRANVQNTGENIEFSIDNSNCSPIQIEKFHKYMDEHQSLDFSINVSSYFSFNTRLADIAELKNAFLFCFIEFGYKYALVKEHELVRLQLVNPKNEMIKKFLLNKNKDEINIHGIALMDCGMKFLVVFLKRCKILLPWFSDANSFYEIINDHIEKGKALNYTNKGFIEIPKTIKLKLDLNV